MVGSLLTTGVVVVAKLVPGVNDLATTHPAVAAEALFDPTAVSPFSHRKVLWRCPQGHEYESSAAHRSSGRGCPVCVGKKIVPGVNDLASRRPSVAAEALFDASAVAEFSHKKLPWKCKKGHVWEATVANRTNLGAGCPYCAGKAVLPGFNDLATQYPSVAAEATFDATAYTGRSNKKVTWRCRQGHAWSAAISDRTVGGQGCPFCAGQRVIPGVNDLATLNPSLAAEAMFDARTVQPFSNKVRRWRDALGHEWNSVVAERSAGQGCPYCSGRRVLVGFNDLATIKPTLAAEALFDPTTVTAASQRRLPWRCAAGHEWTTSPANRRAGTGCPQCAEYGYRTNRPGWLYLMKHEAWGMLQIGITNVPKKRLITHRTHGWTDVDLIGPMDGAVAAALERSLLLMFEKHGVPMTPSSVKHRPRRSSGRVGRRAEAWWRSDLDVPALATLLSMCSPEST